MFSSLIIFSAEGTKHLIFFISQCLRRSYYDTVSSMNTNRVNIFHITYCNTVSFPSRITSYSISFHPAIQRSNKNLTYTGKTKTILKDLYQLMRIMGNTTATSAKCISRTENNRITDLICKCKTIFHFSTTSEAATGSPIFSIVALNSRRSSAFLIVSEVVPIRRTPFFLQESSLLKFHGKVQSCLSSQSWKYAVWFFFLDQLLNHLYCQRFDI